MRRRSLEEVVSDMKRKMPGHSEEFWEWFLSDRERMQRDLDFYYEVRESRRLLRRRWRKG